MKSKTSASTLSRRARGVACAVLATVLSLLAFCALYAPLVRSHGPAAVDDQFAQTAVHNLSLPYPFNCRM